MISCILLCAGLSSRFGSHKALAKTNDHTVIEHLQKTLTQTTLDEIIVVLGDRAEDIKPCLLKHTKVRFVYNNHYNLGQTSSFKVGLLNIHADTNGVLLIPVDYPTIRLETVDSLINTFVSQAPLILIPTFQGKKGHPPIFDIKLKDEFLGLDNSSGINTVEHNHKDETHLFSVDDPGVIKTFNTQEEFEKLRSIMT